MLKNPFYNISEAEKFFPLLYGAAADGQKERYENAFAKYKTVFSEDKAYIASSSGRVEIIGNHTDHNGGKVISGAINLDTLAFFLPADDGIIRIVSEGYKDIVVNLNEKQNYKKGTSFALVCGIADWFKKHDFHVGGFKAFFTSNVCGGAGISSSASFEVLVSEILNFLYNDDKMTAEQKTLASQYSENVFFGKPCGLLDQAAIAYGGLKKLDFSEKNRIKVTKIDNDLSDYSLILINTGGSHADLTDEYASIPEEMFSVAKAMGKTRLSEMSEKEFFERLPLYRDKLSDRAVCRAIHFYQENARVDRAEASLNNNDYENFLSAINESGISSLWKLQNCFVAGSKEQPIPKALAITGSFVKNGANRVHGGGFAGCILNIVKNEEVKDFVSCAERFFDKNSVMVLHIRPVGAIVL